MSGSINLAAIIYVLIIIVTFVVGVIVYAIVYNKNANKVLRTGKPNVLLDKGAFIKMIALFGILILSIIVIIQNANHKNVMKEISNSISELQSQINDLKNQNSALRSEFYNYVEGQKNIYNYSIKIEDLDIEEKKAEVLIKFSIREIHKNSTISVKATSMDDSNDTTEVNVIGSGVYEGTLKLSIESNYSVIIIEETDEIIKTYDTGNIYLKHRFDIDFKAVIEIKEDGKNELIIILDRSSLPEELKPTDIILKLFDKNNNLISNKSIFASLKEEENGFSYKFEDIIFGEEDVFSAQIEIHNALGKVNQGVDFYRINK